MNNEKNIEIEGRFIGCLLLMALKDMNLSDIAGACSGVMPEDFFHRDHKNAFNLIKQKSETGHSFDPTMIAMDGDCDMAYLLDLAKNATSTANTKEYKRRIKSESLRRQGMALANKIFDHIQQSENPIQAVGMAESEIQSLLGKVGDNGHFVHIGKMIQNYIKEVDQELTDPDFNAGYKTGIKTVDDGLVTGFKNGSLVVVGGRPGMGKTSFMLDLITGITRLSGKASLTYSLEMSLSQLTQRMATQFTNRSHTSLIEELKRDPDGLMWNKIKIMADEYKPLPIYMKGSANLKIEDIKSQAREFARNQPVSVIAIDYLTLMDMPDSDRRDLAIGEVTRSLKSLAMELDCVVILLAQLNRAVENRNNKRALPSDFRDSGSIEQDADYIATLYRDSVYNEDTALGNLGEIHFCKTRHSSPFTAYMSFNNGMWVDDKQDQSQMKNLVLGQINPPQPEPKKRPMAYKD